MQLQNEIVCLGKEALLLGKEVAYQVVEHMELLPKTYGGLLIVARSSEQDKWLQALHHTRRYWSWMIKVEEESELSGLLSDGVWEGERSLTEWNELQRRLALFHEPEECDPLLGWLGLVPNRRLMPLRDSRDPNLYRYPLLEAILPELDSPTRFLIAEANRGLLRAEQLVDRIRLCPSCHSGHLNYVEVCPSCRHIDIREKVSLHCFTCGHVGEQHHFTRGGRLQCPKCLTQLRHIGVDYDRPLETHECNQCHHAFVEAETGVNCLSCGTASQVEQLVIRKVLTYSLGEQGEEVLRFGRQLVAPELSLNGKVDKSYFMSLLVWLNKLAQRHDEQHLILALHIPTFEEYLKAFGEAKTFSLTEQLTERLNGLFRETDVCCQYHHDLILVLMPKASLEHLDVLKNKIEEMSRLVESDQFTLDVFAWMLPDPSLIEEGSVWIQQQVSDIYVAG
ncbi:diguanylate cyclase domain-containing protein [Vibrio cholerae]|uniref:TackOD1 domain-containing metal-binding protein n=1 Tax=Vibrio cholerae TaxID=666 RepID=UPI00301DF2D6